MVDQNAFCVDLNSFAAYQPLRSQHNPEIVCLEFNCDLSAF